MGVKVAVVGAGSTYTPELVEGFVTRGDRLPVDELVLLDIDSERLGFVDFTNPTGLVTQALLDHGHRALGLCNVAIGFQREFASLFGVTPDKVQLDHVGLNHLTWERRVVVDGVDRLPDLLDASEFADY